MNARRVPGRLLVTLRLGEMPDDIPSWAAVRRHGVALAARIDGGPIDRLLRHHGSAMRCARLHTSRLPREHRPGVPGARRFDDIEQLSGVARVLRIDVADDGGVPELLQALAQVTSVESARVDTLCHTPFDAVPRAPARQPLDARAAWLSREQIRLSQALALEPGDPAVVVGLADTGVQAANAELLKRLRPGFDTVDLDASIAGELTLVGDNASRDEEPLDEVGHGTACAGILRAGGARLPPGAIGDCGLVPVRVLGAALSGRRRIGIGALANIDAGMKRLIDLGTKVINMSFGTPESALTATDPKPHDEVVRYALARGVLLVAASGNSGLEECYYPAASQGVIAVGASDLDGASVAAFSTRGAHVALCAPGRSIWSCGLDGVQKVSGTSFASPFVAAVCALLIARAERRAWPLSAALARHILTQTAQPFRDTAARGSGSGTLDALAALRRLDTEIDDALAARTGDDDR